MKRVKFLKEEIVNKRAELSDINTICDSETRARNADETALWGKIKEDIAELESELKDVEELEAAKAERASKASKIAREAAALAGAGVSNKGENKEKDEAKVKYSLSAAMKSLVSNKPLTGREAEVNEEAEAEMRGTNFETAGGISFPAWMMEARTDIDQATSAIKPTVVGAYVDAIREGAIYEKVGATILNGLTADYKIPVVTKQSLAWATAENSAAADGGANFAKDTLTPIRLTGYVDVSNRIMLQNGEGAMQAIMRDLGRETANKISDALFASSDVANAIPSIAGTSGVLTFTEAAAYAANSSIYSDFVDAEQTLAVGEGLQGKLAYVGSPTLMADLKQSARVSSVIPAMTNQIMGQASVNGYQTEFTNSSTSATFVFGDFQKLYIGFFGGLSLTIDPYSTLLNDQRRIVVHRHLDSSLVQGAAFVKATSLLV